MLPLSLIHSNMSILLFDLITEYQIGCEIIVKKFAAIIEYYFCLKCPSLV